MITLIIQTDSVEDARQLVQQANDFKCLTVTIRDGKVVSLPSDGADS